MRYRVACCTRLDCCQSGGSKFRYDVVVGIRDKFRSGSKPPRIVCFERALIDVALANGFAAFIHHIVDKEFLAG
jgi:hypothetical protein